MLFAEAVKIVTTELSKDNLRRLAYVANIAYEFESEYTQYINEIHFRPLTREDVCIISRRAAKHFLEMWLLNADKEG